MTTPNTTARFETVELAAADGDNWPRIPGLVVTNSGAVLALYNWRRGGQDDFGHETDVVFRRSDDGGRTWGPPVTLVTEPGVDAHLGPAVVDRIAGRIIVFYRPRSADIPEGVTHVGRYFVERPDEARRTMGQSSWTIASDDDGLTWSEPEEVVLQHPDAEARLIVGNATHGIQLRGGRLAVAGGFYDSSRLDDRQMASHACLVVSDDHGASWRVTGAMPSGSLQECVIAECADGSIYANFRRPMSTCRGACRSTDGGETFGPTLDETALPDARCHAGLARYAPEADPGGDRLLFTNIPGAYDGEFRMDTRRGLRISLSEDGGRTWPVRRTIEEGPSGYSDVVVLPDGAILVLYERGDKISYERMAVARFNLAWVRGGDGDETVRR